MKAMVFHNGGGKDFVLFGDGILTEEPVTDADLTTIRAMPESPYRSQVWSCNIDWYFVLDENGLALLSATSMNGFLCRKKSLNFIRMFLGDKLSA